MPDLATLRKQIPALDGLDDASAVDVLHQVYYPDLPIERVQQAVGYTPPPPPPDDSSNIARGAKVALGQTMPLLKGVVGLAGATAESALGADTFLGQQAGKVKNWGLSGYQEGMAKLEPMARENDDVTVAWKKAQGGDIGALLDWAQYGIGYALGQGGEAVATSLLGGVAGAAAAPGLAPITGTAGAVTGLVAKGAVKDVARTLIERAVVKEANKLLAETAAAGGKITAEEATKQATKSIASEIGQTAAMLAYGNVQELGSIYPDAEQNARQAGAPGLDGSGLARVWGWGLAAGGLEGLTEKLGVDVALGKAKLPGAGTRLGQGAMQGAAGALVEGGTEAAQTVMEHAGANEDLWDSAKQQNDIINSSALGAIGGLVIGGAAGLLHGPRAHARQQAQQLQDKVIAEIGAAPTVDDAITAFTKAATTPITVPPGFDADAAMGRLDQHAQADAKSMRQGTGLPGSGVPELQRELAAQPQPSVALPDLASGSAPTSDAAAGSAKFVPVEEFGDRLITLRDKLEQPRVRQQIRDVLGDAALGDILYYAKAADNPNLPGTTSDRMLQVAEVMTDRALAQPTGPQAKVETAPGVPALPAAPQQSGSAPTPALSGAPATMRVNAAGEAAPETAEQAQRTAARQTQDFQMRGEPQQQPGGLPAPGATPLLTVDEAAHQAAPSPQNALPEPTQGQKEAGNYKLGHIRVGGLDISVENPQGSVRSGVDKNGKPWSNTLRDHYGYIRGTTGADGDHVDTFIKAGTPTDWNGPVFVVDQRHDNGAGKFDEVKAMLGYGGELEARAAYLRNYHRGWTGGTHIRAASFDAFKAWLADPAATRRPFAEWQGNGSTQRPPEARPLSTPALQDVEQHEGALPQSEGDGLRELRRPGDQGGAGAGGELHGVPGSGGRAANAEASARPGEQRPGLRAGQSALDDEARAGEQPAQERAADARGTHADAGAVGGGNRAGTLGAALPDQRGAHERGGSADNAGTRGTTQGAVALSGRAWWEAATPEQRADMMRTIGRPELAGKAGGWEWDKLSAGMRAAVMGETQAYAKPTAPAPTERPEVVQLRKRASVLKSLLECMG